MRADPLCCTSNVISEDSGGGSTSNRRARRVFLVSQHADAESNPCLQIADIIVGDHSWDTVGFEHCLGKLRLNPRGVGLHRNNAKIAQLAPR